MTHLWWQTEIIYQIYPRSYQDSNGDGIGDLPGIIDRLDYVKSLNMGAVWLSPIYPSPMHDFGYDVSDYTDIHPMFGTLADFDRLRAATQERGLKLILDLVPNHTSDEHPWFIESRSSRDNPKRDWYIWRDPAPDGGPPNNWQSFFGGPAWTFDETTGQYYMHQFVSQQPELNYRHPEVVPAMQNCMRFWLDRGVDGFRVDVIYMMMKDAQLRDNPPHPTGIDDFGFPTLHIRKYTQNLPEVHDVIRELRSVVDEYEQRVMIGEIYLPYDDLMTYYGADLDECHMPFNFHLVGLPWQADKVGNLIDRYEAKLPVGGWPNWVLGNHDQHRIASRIGPDQARVANMLLLTLRGSPTCYYGDEIGMENVPIPPEFIQDPPAVNNPELADKVGRDPERTPMQWDASPNAGFTDPAVTPWLPIADDYTQRNVAVQEDDPDSMLHFFRRLTELRQAEPALNRGDYQRITIGTNDVLLYQRTAAGHDSFMVVLNFGTNSHTLNVSHIALTATIALNTSLDREGSVDLSNLTLGPNEGLILRL